MPAKAKAPEKGICFPKDAKGGRSTSDAGKKIIAAALRGAGTSEGNKFAEQCDKERNWRFGYVKHFKNLVKASAASPKVALGVARAGAEYMQKNFEFVAPVTGSVSDSFGEYMSSYKAGTKGEPAAFETGVIKGSRKDKRALAIDYQGKELSGAALKAQMEAWAQYGTIEEDAALAICSLADGNVDLSDKHFVLIGAGSAMGPYSKLLEHGATVVCIDIPGMWGERPAGMWARLIKIARESSGQIIFPLSVPQSSCKDDAALFKAIGCNLTEYPAQILHWLQGVAPGKSLCVGNYTYLDGELHVKLSLAADALISGLCVTRKDTKVAFLCTPTDLHVITDSAHKAAVANYGWHPGRLVEAFFNLISFGKALQRNSMRPLPTEDATKTIKVVDGLSVAQGPNYALAKRLQHWRAMLAFEAGHTVSSNIAPSTATLSVVSNRTFGWAYGGMPYFKPYEIFQQETTNGVMGAMLIYDATDKTSAANPANRTKYGIDNTMELFKFNSVHGGVWRAAYTVNSIGEVSVLIHFLGGPSTFLPVFFFLLAAIAYLTARFTGHIQ